MTSPDYRRFRRLHGVNESDLFHVAHSYLRRTADIEGPLSWRPGLRPALTAVGASADDEQAPSRIFSR